MSVFPFINPPTENLQSDALPLFKEYAYDFKDKCLLLRNGNTYFVTGNEALKIWIYKTLMTVRYRYIAHTTTYGNEVQTLLGAVLSSDILISELRRFIIESLMVNPYIVELSNFQFDKKSDGVTVEFNCKTIYGDMIQNIEFSEVTFE